MAGSSRPAGSVIDAPNLDDFDVTITSTTDDVATVRTAVGLDDAGADDEDDKGAADEGTEEKPAAAPVAKPAAAAEPAPGTEDYEPPVAGETTDQRTDRIERNVSRIQKLNTTVANKNQAIDVLREENVRLRQQIEKGGKPAGDGTGDGTTTAVEEPKFEFPNLEAWLEKNPDGAAEEYYDARTDARTAFNNAVERHRLARTHTARAQETLLADSQAHIEAFRAATPDYDAVIAASRAPMSNTMHLAMLKAGKLGPAIAYHLSKDAAGVAKATAIYQQDGIDQVREIAELAITLKGGAAAPAAAAAAPAGKTGEAPTGEEPEHGERPAPSRRTTNAPKPLPVAAGPASGAPDLANMSDDDYIRHMDNRDRERGRRR